MVKERQRKSLTGTKNLEGNEMSWSEIMVLSVVWTVCAMIIFGLALKGWGLI